MKKQIIFTAWAAFILAACTNEESSVADFTHPVAVSFTGEVSEAQTRAEVYSNDNLPTNIGISILQLNYSNREESDYRNVEYSWDEESNTYATLNPFYFETAQEEAYFIAYAPYSENVSQYHQIDISADEKGNVDDYVWAETESLDFSSFSDGPVKLTFKHMMSQIKVIGALDETSIKSEKTYIESITLSHVISSGKFSIVDGSVEEGEDVSSVSTSGEKTDIYTVIPQEGIVVTLTTKDTDASGTTNTYQTTLPALESGNSYTFTVTAEKTQLGVTAEVTEWESKPVSLTAGMKGIDQFDVFKDPADAKLYDLVFSDGSFMRLTDSEGNLPESSITIPEGKTASGVVFWLGDATGEDTALQSNYGSCTHGLIVALKNTDEVSISLVTMSNEVMTSDNHLGYHNTILMTKGRVNPDLSRYISAITTDITDCSSWYVPSKGDALSLIDATTDLNKILHLIDNASLLSYYWTSTVADGASIYYYVDDGQLAKDPYDITNEGYLYIRPICAF
jgi:hypothetical protein